VIGPDDLCGPASTVARRLVAKARKLHDDPAVPVKILLYGPPGVGKTSIADMVADALSGTRFAIEEFNGKLVTVETVKQWMGTLGVCSLFGVHSVFIKTIAIQDTFFTAKEHKDRRKLWIESSFFEFSTFLRGY